MKRPENGFQSKMDLLMTEIDAPLIGGNCNCRVNYVPSGWTRPVLVLVVAAANCGKEFLFVSARLVSMILKDPSLCLNSQNENSQMSKQPSKIQYFLSLNERRRSAVLLN